MPANRVWIKNTLAEKAKKFGVRIADYANVGNHLHLKIKISDRKLFGQFLKSITALVARRISGARRGKPFGRFWDGLAYTRVLKSRLEELNLKGYIAANRLEVRESRSAREEYLCAFRGWVYGELCSQNSS